MPHKCMDCKNLIESGTIDLQKGCPICGGKKFQYVRTRPQPDDKEKPTVAEYVNQAALREPQLEAREAPLPRPGRKPRDAQKEKAYQEVVTPQPVTPPEITSAYRTVERHAPERRPVEKKPVEKAKPAPKEDGDTVDRVESIRIVENGTYDINLPLMLNRKGLVMSKGYGDYVVDLNSALKTDKKKKRKAPKA